MIRISALVVAGCLSAFHLLPPPCMQAQAPDTVIFAHGLNQSGDDWDALAADLASRHAIHPFTPTLDSKRSYSTQAANLSSALGPFNSVSGAISHSNGGAVVREYIRTTATPRVDRHLSLGTPHRGANLADAAYNGSLGVLLQIGFEIVDPFFWYESNDPNWPYLQLDGVNGFYASNLAWDVSDFIVTLLPAGMSALGIFTGGWNILSDVVPDMRPGSSFFATLNSSANLASESQKTDARVSISTQYPRDLAPYRAMATAAAIPLLGNLYAEELHYSVQDLQVFAMDAYWYYLSHPNWELRNNAYRWWDAAIALGSIPGVWEAYTGTVANQGDGIVPWSSSTHPGATKDYKVLCSALCIHHTEQLWDWQLQTNPLRQAISHAIENDLYEEPPPPLNVTINGPTVVPANESCSWSADVSGGQGGTFYSWSGVLSGSNSVVSGPIQQSGWLYLTVTRGQEQENDQLYVTLDPMGPPLCPF